MDKDSKFGDRGLISLTGKDHWNESRQDDPYSTKTKKDETVSWQRSNGCRSEVNRERLVSRVALYLIRSGIQMELTALIHM